MLYAVLTRQFPSSALVLAFSATALFAASEVPARDDQAIRQRLAIYAQARMERDAHKEALCYTEDGDFRSSLGPFVRGREAVEKQLTVTDPSYRFTLEVVSIRMIDPGVAVVDTAITGGVGGNMVRDVGTYIMSKRKGAWLINAARIARIDTPPAVKPAVR